MKLPVNRAAPLVALALLSGCGGTAPVRDVSAAQTNGPAADYPMVVGDPFVIDGVTYTPVDKMNYDAVGYAGVDMDLGSGVAVSHRTLPLPSYVEITALDTGKTILARVERRGPMTNSRLIDLSPGAAAQLGLTGAARTGLRVRRVNPPEADRALLRSGAAASARMDTPKSLLAVLNRKLDQQNGTPAPAATTAPVATPTAPAAKPRRTAVTRTPRPGPTASTAATAGEQDAAAAGTPPSSSAPVAPTGGYFVQIGAFSSQQRATAQARKAGAQTSRSGNLWRVRMGPFATQAAADAALAKARRAGYSDARVQRAD